MKKVLQIIAVALAGVIGAVSVAAADTVSCADILATTGPGSTNYAYCENNQTSNITCNNNVNVNNSNNQGANSGSSNNNGNTSSGGASSGSASNSNSTSFDATVSCGSYGVPVATTPVAPSQPAGGMGSGAVATAPAAKVFSLPDTGISKTMTTAIASIVIVAAVLLGTQAGFKAYRRLAVK